MRSGQARVGNRFLPSIVGKLGALVLVALYLAVQPAAAGPLTYTLSNATAIFSQGTVDLSGTFTIDPQTGNPSNIDVTATGPLPPLAQSPDVFTNPLTNGSASIIVTDSSSDQLTFIFNQFLTNAPAILTFEEIDYTTTTQAFGTSSTTGSANVGVPEPASLAIFVSALAAMGFFGRRRRDAV